jgi:hypothetical protein
VKKIVSVFLIAGLLIGLCVFSVSAAGEPKVKIIAGEKETEVDVKVYVGGNIAKFDMYDILIGYTTDKLTLKGGAAGVDMQKPLGWSTNAKAEDRAVYQNTAMKFVEISNLYDASGGVGNTIAVTEGNDVLLAAFTFTKAGTIVSDDIFYPQSGFKTNVITTRYAKIANDGVDIFANTTPDLVSVTVNSLGVPPAPPSGNDGISAKIEAASTNIAYLENGIVDFNIKLEKFTGVKNFLIDFSYDSGKLILQNSTGDTGINGADTYLITDNSGNARIIASLNQKQTSEAAVTVYTLKFKMKETAKNTATSVILSKFAAGIATEKGDEVTAPILVGSGEVTMNEYVFGYDINGDGKTDLGDLVCAEGFLGATTAGSNWNNARKADENGDGQVSVADLINIAVYIAKNH